MAADGNDLPATVGLPAANALHPDVGGPSAGIESALRTERLEGFLSAATARLIAESDAFTLTLGIAATKVAKARGGTAVDDGDVAVAARTLRWTSLRDQWWLCVAVGLAGAAVALLMTLVLATDKPEHTNWWYAACGLTLFVTVGIALWTYPFKQKTL